MKGVLLVPAALGVMGLAFWAYQENYRTQSATRHAAEVSREIGQLRERLALLNAEWAYLNRPDRLAELANLNFPALGLLPFSPDHFGIIGEVAFPPDPIELIASGAIETRMSADGEMLP